MFGSAIPVLFAIAAAYFWLGTWIDRSNLLRYLAPPPPTDESLTRAAALYLFTSFEGVERDHLYLHLLRSTRPPLAHFAGAKEEEKRYQALFALA